MDWSVVASCLTCMLDIVTRSSLTGFVDPSCFPVRTSVQGSLCPVSCPGGGAEGSAEKRCRTLRDAEGSAD